jgi:glutathione S-transferase
MKVYSSWSPNPQKVLFALKELGLPAKIMEVDLFHGEQRKPEFTALNPMQKVPVAEDEGFVLWEKCNPCLAGRTGAPALASRSQRACRCFAMDVL